MILDNDIDILIPQNWLYENCYKTATSQSFCTSCRFYCYCYFIINQQTLLLREVIEKEPTKCWTSCAKGGRLDGLVRNSFLYKKACFDLHASKHINYNLTVSICPNFKGGSEPILSIKTFYVYTTLRGRSHQSLGQALKFCIFFWLHSWASLAKVPVYNFSKNCKSCNFIKHKYRNKFYLFILLSWQRQETLFYN